MELKVWHCIRCDTDFKSGQWVGCRGVSTEPHEVAPKTYYSVATPFLLMQWKTDRRVPDEFGTVVSIGGKSAQFKDGQFTTTDPEEQEHMDGYLARSLLQTGQQYTDAMLTPAQKLDRQKIQIEEQNRLIQKLQDEKRLLEEGVVAQHEQSKDESQPSKSRRTGPRPQ